MNVRSGGRLAAALLGSALALLAAAPATAGPGARQASVKIGQLVLAPSASGYQGSLPVTVTNRGKAAEYFTVRITEPVVGSFDGLAPAGICFSAGRIEDRRIFECEVPGPDLAPGEQRRFDATFEVLTAPRPYAMIATGGLVAVVPGSTGQIADQVTVNARFRSTTGSLRDPQPYVRDSRADAMITIAGSVTLTRQADGTYAGRLPVTVRYAGDAAHDYLSVQASLPAGVEFAGTDPQDAPGFNTFFEIPGGPLSAGEERSFDVLFRAPAETAPGNLGTASYLLETRFGDDVVEDADPTDNVASFTVDVR